MIMYLSSIAISSDTFSNFYFLKRIGQNSWNFYIVEDWRKKTKIIQNDLPLLLPPPFVPIHLQSFLGQSSTDSQTVFNGVCCAALTILAFKAAKLMRRQAHAISFR